MFRLIFVATFLVRSKIFDSRLFNILSQRSRVGVIISKDRLHNHTLFLRWNVVRCQERESAQDTVSRLLSGNYPRDCAISPDDYTCFEGAAWCIRSLCEPLNDLCLHFEGENMAHLLIWTSICSVDLTWVGFAPSSFATHVPNCSTWKFQAWEIVLDSRVSLISIS